MSPRLLPRRLHGEERGQTILVFALMFVALLGFSAMVVDAGVVYWNRRLLQNAVDAAALAGAAQLPTDPTGAIQAAVTFAETNGVAGSELICFPNGSYPAGVTCQAGQDATFGLRVTQTFSPNDTVVVSARRTIGFGLRYIVGAGDTNVVATASAIAAAENPGDIAPWAISEQQVTTQNSANSTPTPCTSDYTPCSLKVGGQSGASGNFQAIDWAKATPGAAGACPQGGAQCYNTSLLNGYTGPIATPVTTTPEPVWDWNVPTKTGNIAGDTNKAIATFFARDQNKICDNDVSCPNLFVTPLPTLTSSGVNFNTDASDSSGNAVACYEYVECPRVVVVPFVTQPWSSSSLNGTSVDVTIVNFGCFYITGTNGNTGQLEVDGMFVPTCRSLTGQAWYGIPLSAGGILGNNIGTFLWR